MKIALITAFLLFSQQVLATEIDCRYESASYHSYFSFRAQPITASVHGIAFDGQRIVSEGTEIYLNDQRVCGEQVNLKEDCTVQEHNDVFQNSGAYSLWVSCKTGQHENLIYSHGKLNVYCFGIHAPEADLSYTGCDLSQ